jgi:hypothetical protein
MTTEPPIIEVHETAVSVEGQYSEWGVQVGYINGVEDSADPLEWDQTRVDDWLATIPVDYDGVVVPDWENEWIAAIHAGSSDPDHATALANGIALLQYIKTARPNAMVGFYGLPTREFWNQDQAWYDAMDDAAPLFAEQTALFPSVYDLYGSDPDPGHPNYQSARDHERLGEVVRLAIELALGKPVYPYFWHRHHNSTPQWGFQLIPSNEFRAHINHMVDVVNHNGVYVDGIVAWGAESYYHTAGFRDNDPDYCGWNECGDDWDRIRAAYTSEMNPGETIEEYLARLMPRVYQDYALAMGTLSLAPPSPGHVVVSNVDDVTVEITSPVLRVEVIQEPVSVGGAGGGGTGRVGGEFVGIIGAPLEVGQEAAVRMAYSGTISKWTIMSRETGTIEFDVYKDVWGNFPPTEVDSIVGASPPTMVDDDNAEDVALTGWTKTVTAGDVLVFAIAGVDGTLSHAILQLDILPS